MVRPGLPLWGRRVLCVLRMVAPSARTQPAKAIQRARCCDHRGARITRADFKPCEAMSELRRITVSQLSPGQRFKFNSAQQRWFTCDRVSEIDPLHGMDSGTRLLVFGKGQRLVNVADYVYVAITTKRAPRPVPVPGVLFVLALLFASCVSTRPASAFIRMDGTRVGIARQTIFLHPRDETGAIHVAMDHAGITVVDSITTKRRPRAFGSLYLVTVTGK